MTELKSSIALVGFERKEAGMLEVLLSGSDAQGFILAPLETANALLVDYDTVVSNIHQADQWKAEFAKRPAIIVTSNPNNVEAGSIILSRPLAFDQLKGALRELKEKVRTQQESLRYAASSTESQGKDDEVTVPQKAPIPLKLDRQTLRSMLAEAIKERGPIRKKTSEDKVEQRLPESNNSDEVVTTPKTIVEPRPKRSLLDWSVPQKQELELQCCGHYEDINLQDPADRKRITINLQGQFITLAREAVSLASREKLPVQITGIPGVFIYLPADQKFAFNLDNGLLLQTARSRFGVGELQLQERPDLSDVDFPRANVTELLWTLSLITVQGRVPDYLDIGGEMKLVRAPDFDRLLSIPYSRSIARLWVSRSYSALDIVGILAIPQRFVFSFMVAADTVGLFERK